MWRTDVGMTPYSTGPYQALPAVNGLRQPFFTSNNLSFQ